MIEGYFVIERTGCDTGNYQKHSMAALMDQSVEQHDPSCVFGDHVVQLKD